MGVEGCVLEVYEGDFGVFVVGSEGLVLGFYVDYGEDV